MSTATKRIEGAAEELKGKIKKGFGRLTGDERTEAEGRAEESFGRGKQEAAKAVERAKGRAEQVIGGVKKHIGQAVGDRRVAAEGKAKQLEGRARQKLNR